MFRNDIAVRWGAESAPIEKKRLAFVKRTGPQILFKPKAITVRKRPAKQQKRWEGWTEENITILVKMKEQHKSWQDIARAIGSTPGSVRKKYGRLKCSVE